MRAGPWVQLGSEDSTPAFGEIGFGYSYYLSLPYLVLAFNAKARFTWAAPLIYQSSLSQFRAYTVGEQLAHHLVYEQVEARIPFGKTRFGASVFGGLATLFDNPSDWGDSNSYNPMGGGGLRFILNEQQQSIIHIEYAQGIRGARGIYLAMGQPFH